MGKENSIKKKTSKKNKDKQARSKLDIEKGPVEKLMKMYLHFPNPDISPGTMLGLNTFSFSFVPKQFINQDFALDLEILDIELDCMMEDVSTVLEDRLGKSKYIRFPNNIIVSDYSELDLYDKKFIGPRFILEPKSPDSTIADLIKKYPHYDQELGCETCSEVTSVFNFKKDIPLVRLVKTISVFKEFDIMPYIDEGDGEEHIFGKEQSERDDNPAIFDKEEVYLPCFTMQFVSNNTVKKRNKIYEIMENILLDSYVQLEVYDSSKLCVSFRRPVTGKRAEREMKGFEDFLKKFRYVSGIDINLAAKDLLNDKIPKAFTNEELIHMYDLQKWDYKKIKKTYNPKKD